MVLRRLWSKAEVAAMLSEVWRLYPLPGQYLANRHRPEMGGLRRHPFAGFSEFPFSGPTLNAFPFDERLVSLARAVLATAAIRLFKCNLWVKYPRAANYDQPLHLDYPDHTLVVPPCDHLDMVTFITYLTDARIDSGPTYVVRRDLTRHLPVSVTTCSRRAQADVYSLEEPVLAAEGDTLLYGPLTYHRGSALSATSGARVILTAGYRRAESEWIGFQSWPRAAATEDMARLLQALSPDRLDLLGFPGPRSSYWTAETRAAVQRRYPLLPVDRA